MRMNIVREASSPFFMDLVVFKEWKIARNNKKGSRGFDKRSQDIIEKSQPTAIFPRIRSQRIFWCEIPSILGSGRKNFAELLQEFCGTLFTNNFEGVSFVGLLMG